MNYAAKIYDRTVGNEYRNERKKFAIAKSKNILHIGSGSYPITAMVLAESNGVNIVTIDNNIRAVKRANKVIKRKNLNGKIKAKYGKGTNIPLDNFDTIIVSGCSIPKIKVLEHVLKNASSKSNIIARVSSKDIERIKNNLSPDQKIKIVKKLKNHLFPNSSWDSFLIIKD
jgi:protein-L-isoaspartate O-methyltransferase